MRIGLLVLLVGLAACSGPRRSSDPVVRDQEIVRDIAVKYHDDPRFDRVQIACSDGRVTLDGVVTDDNDRNAACRIAYGVSGVQEVTCRLKLRSR